VCTGQVRTYRQSSLGLGQRAAMVPARPQNVAENHTSFGVAAVERNRPARQCLGGSEDFGQIAYLKAAGCLQLSDGEASVPPGEARVEINGLLKEFLSHRVVVCTKFAPMPKPALVGGPGVKAPRRFAHRASKLSVGNGRGDGDCYRFGDLVLQCKDVGEIAIVALGPAEEADATATRHDHRQACQLPRGKK
jgi:hypothetical protein